MQTALIALDSNQLTLILSKMLEDLGFEALTTQNYDDVAPLCAAQTPVVLFCDWTLQEKEMPRLFPTLKPRPVIIFISTVIDPDKMEQALKLGAKEYIMKPFDNDILQSKLALAGLL